jgi:hypothetical protein
VVAHGCEARVRGASEPATAMATATATESLASRLATIIEVHGRWRRDRASRQVIYSVREGSEGHGPAVFASTGEGSAGVDAARAQAFAWCRRHGYEVAGYIEMPPRRA